MPSSFRASKSACTMAIPIDIQSAKVSLPTCATALRARSNVSLCGMTGLLYFLRRPVARATVSLSTVRQSRFSHSSLTRFVVAASDFNPFGMSRSCSTALARSIGRAGSGVFGGVDGGGGDGGAVGGDDKVTVNAGDIGRRDR